MRRVAVGILAVVVLGGVSACDETAPDLAEWTVDDHNHQAKTNRSERSSEMVTKDTRSAPSKRNLVADITWTKQCANCHGKRGRGDGPQSTMVKARDLTIPEWQDTVTDEHLAKVIREGKDKMPAFNLPDSVIQGLIEQIRGWRKRVSDGKEEEQEDDDERAPNAPASVAAPAGAAPTTPAPTTPASAMPASRTTPAPATPASPAPAPAPR
jgi:cytochrome c553